MSPATRFSTGGLCPECSKSEKAGAIVEAPQADGPAIFYAPVGRRPNDRQDRIGDSFARKRVVSLATTTSIAAPSEMNWDVPAVPSAGCVRRTYGCRSFRDRISAYILCGRRPDPAHGDLTMRAFSSQRSLSSVMARNWTDVFHTGARWSRRGRDAHSHLRDACAGGNLPGHRRPLHGKGNGRSHDRDQPDERFQPHRHRIRVRSHLLMTCDPLRSKQEMNHDCDEKRDRQPRRRGSAR
jgi:hypothetical protein